MNRVGFFSVLMGKNLSLTICLFNFASTFTLLLMKALLRLLLILITLNAPAGIFGQTPILGSAELEVEHMFQYIRSHNAEFPREIAEAYYIVGERYGIRGDIALCQAIIETGWFTFCGGTAVTIDQNNFCGLGVTKLGLKGLSFETIEKGVTAQMQHLFAYACLAPLPESEELLDPASHL